MKNPHKKNLLIALAMAATVAMFPCVSTSMATTTTNAETFSWGISTTLGSSGNVLTATNASGVLTNGLTVSSANNISYTGGGASDTSLTVYGYSTKATTSSKGFVLYSASTVAGIQDTVAQALTNNHMFAFSITAGANETITLTNALGLTSSGGTNIPTNWGFFMSTVGPINATSGFGGTNGTQVGNTVVQNNSLGSTAIAPLFGINNSGNMITILPGTTSYFAIVFAGALSTGTADQIIGGSSAFSLVGQSVVISGSSYKYWAAGTGNWNTTSTSWAAANGGTATNTFTANDFAVFTNTATVTVTNTGINSSGVTVTNASGTTVALSGGSITSSNLTKLAAGTLTLGMSNSLGTVTISGGTVAIGANNQGAAAVTVNSASLTGSGTVTGTSFSMSNSTISASLAGTAGMTVNGNNVLGVAAMTTNTLSGNNTYSGGTSINGGKLVAGSGTAFGTGTISMGASNVVLDLNGQSIANNITNSLSGYSVSSLGNGGIINSSSNAATISGNIKSTGALQVTVGSVYDGASALIASNGGTVTISGNITSSSATKAFSKNGSGTLILTGSNSIGVLSAGDGVIIAQGPNSIAGSTLTGFGSATNTGELRLGTAAAYTMNNINVGGAVHVSSSYAGSTLEFTNTGAAANISVGTANKNFYTDSNTAVTFDGGFEFGGTTATKGSRTIIFQNDGPVTIQGPVAYTDPLGAGNSGYISKAGGNGTLTFNGANSLAQQASIQQGTVVIGAGSSLGTYGGVILGGTNSTAKLDLSSQQASGYSLEAAQNTITNYSVSNSYAGNVLISTTTNASYTNTVSAIRGNGTIDIGTGTITSSGISPSWYSTLTTTNQSGTAGTYTTTQAFFTNAGVTTISGNLAFDSSAVTTLDISSLSQAGSTTSGGGDGYDQIVINSGTLAYNGTLHIDSPLSLAALFGGSTTSVVLFSGMTSVSGDLLAVDYNGIAFTAGLDGNNWVYDSGTGAIYGFCDATGTLALVPEPGTCAMAGLGLTALTITLIRRRRSGS